MTQCNYCDAWEAVTVKSCTVNAFTVEAPTNRCQSLDGGQIPTGGMCPSALRRRTDTDRWYVSVSPPEADRYRQVVCVRHPSGGGQTPTGVCVPRCSVLEVYGSCPGNNYVQAYHTPVNLMSQFIRCLKWRLIITCRIDKSCISLQRMFALFVHKLRH